MGRSHYAAKNFGFAHHFILPVLALVAVGLIGVASLRTSSAASKSYVNAKNFYNTLIPAVSDDMNSLSTVQSKWYANVSDPSINQPARQAIYNPPGVTTYAVKDGILSLSAQRHCVADKSVAMTQANVSTAKCATGQTTKYSAGRLESKELLSGTFLIEVRAKMPSTPAYGVRSALWMVNVPPNGPYCGKSVQQTNLSEFDFLEWYSDSGGSNRRGINKPTSSTHILCQYDTKRQQTKWHSSTGWSSQSSSWYTKWHVFSFRYNSKSTQYFVDGKLTHEVKNTDSSSKKQSAKWKRNNAPTEKQWAQATENMSWRIIFHQEVFDRAKNSKKFPAQTTLIDYVHVYRHSQ